jgi:hypothetical protein
MFKKEKKVKLTFHTYHTKQLIDMFSPKLAGQLVPEWFKTLKVSKNKLFPNMNSCPGMVDLFKNTINIPLWQDFHIKYDKGQVIDVDVPGVPKGNEQHFIQQHHPDQWNGAFKGYTHVKLMSPWLVTAEGPYRDIPFLLHAPSWHHTEQLGMFNVLPGELNFAYQSATAINMFLQPTLGPAEITLEAGNIIAYLTPLQHDVKIEIETKWVTEEEWRSLMKHHFTFDGFYRKTKKWLDRGRT